jgi:hypothetical protein
MIVVLPSLGNGAPGIKKTRKKNRPASFASQRYSPQYLLCQNQAVRSRSPSFPRYRDRFKTKTIGWLKTSEKDKETTATIALSKGTTSHIFHPIGHPLRPKYG